MEKRRISDVVGKGGMIYGAVAADGFGDASRSGLYGDRECGTDGDVVRDAEISGGG